MQVKEVMSREVLAVGRSMSLKEILRMFKDFHVFPLVPVVEEGNRLVGVVSFRNIIDAFQYSNPDVLKLIPFLDEEESIFELDVPEDMGDLILVEDIMDREYLFIREDAALEEVYSLMKMHLKEELPVVDRIGRLVGRVGIFDIVKSIFKESRILSE